MSRLAGVILAACCGAISVACGTAPAVSAAPTATAARPASARTVPARPAVAYDCRGRHDGEVKPATVFIDCLSGNVFVQTRSWAYWNPAAAKTSQPGHPRTAALWVNSCKPSCAAGNYLKYKAVLSFFRPRAAGGIRYYTRMRLRYTHNGARDYTYRWGTFPGGTLPGWIGGPSGPGA